jgi:hypothetical protein
VDAVKHPRKAGVDKFLEKSIILNMNAPQRTAEQIKADNKKFKKLSQPRKRVAIARDALAQLGLRLRPVTGKWVQFDEILNITGLNEQTQVQSVLNETAQCNVCAKGALFVCLVDRTNDVTLSEAPITTNYAGCASQIHGRATDPYLTRLFSENQLDLIEIAFEGKSFAFMTGLDANNTFEEKTAAEDFFRVFGHNKKQNAELRLRAIFENIIANNGTFKPEILPVQKWVTPGFRG